MTHESWAPANLALIKYMGKLVAQPGAQASESIQDLSLVNRPTNSSLSITLNHLRTHVRLTALPKDKVKDKVKDKNETATSDQWKPWNREGEKDLVLNEAGRSRFLKHFAYLKNQWGIEENFLVESYNNFPSDCGLASSASSFAALTKASVELFEKLKPRASFDPYFDMPELSRRASGSSCRSFAGPFVLWYSEGVRPLEFPFGPLDHQVIVISAEKKEVSSSEAHRRVVSSLNFRNRPARAEERLAQLIEAFQGLRWREAFEICWAEFMDMHALFETSQPPFGYRGASTMQVLEDIKADWIRRGDGPLVTMDAGPNVHALFRQDQKDLAADWKAKFEKRFPVIDSQSWIDQ